MATYMIVARDPNAVGVKEPLKSFFSWQDLFTDIFSAGTVDAEVVEVIERQGSSNVFVYSAADLAPVAVKVHEWADVNESWRSVLP